jgi:4,5-dihydroxyphthalate decarboxylase
MNAAITMAMTGYDHVLDIARGRVEVTGVDLTYLELPAPEIFARFVANREWQVSELSLAKYVALRASGDDSLTAIPVFPSRSWRHSALFVDVDGPRHPSDLAGKRIGVPEWAQTAAVWTRALLQHEWGVDLRGVSWVQAGLDQSGRREKVALRLPDGVSVTPMPGYSLDELLVAGEIDAILSAHAPASSRQPGSRIVRMATGGMDAEREYTTRTGIFPIMHIVAIRADVAAQFPWLAGNLMSSFEQSKANSLARLRELGVSRYPVPWLGAHLDEIRDVFGADPWPYGVDANRATLEAFVEYCAEQGVAETAIPIDQLFAQQVLDRVRI